MTKVYKELEKAFKSIEDKNNGVPGNMPIVATGTPMIDIYRIANSLLLEALSDKEEDLIIGDFVKKDNKGKWVNCFGYEKEGVVVGTDPLKVVEEPKQEECEHIWQSSTKLTQSCEKCAFVKTKQSTSLKGMPLRDRIDFIQVRLLNDHMTTKQSSTEILELIKSHLLKEIKGKSFYGPDLEDMFWEKDIIKIINNISK